VTTVYRSFYIPDRDCPECEGEGIGWDGEPCSACGGDGALTVDEEEIEA
jgi:DnaJ-class molecular chaperone